MFNFPEGEILFINKPLRWTSFDVVGKIRVIMKQQLAIKKIKVGHAGTLDPLATGLLIICTGKFTKKIDEFQGLQKTYTGTFFLGATTPSYDLETAIDNTCDINHLKKETILAAAKKFTGTQWQTPPVFSAVKIKGKRAYNMARNHEEVVLPPKEVNILRFEITNINLPEIGFIVDCSKGTYIRSLANDFGKELGCGAYLSSLCRTAIGGFSLDDAITIEQFEFLVSQQKS